MATVTLASLGLGNADLTAIGKLSETGLSQTEIADAVVEGDKLKKGTIPAGQVGAYTKAEVDGIIDNIPEVDLSDYYNKAEVDSLIDAIPETDLSNYYDKTEVDNIIDNIPPTDLSNYYDKTETYNKSEVDNIIDNIPPTDLSGYYDKTETETLLSNKQDKEVGKGLSTNDFTDTFKQALELNKVQNILTDSVNKKLVVTYTNGTFVDLNLDDVVTDVKVEGAVLDATTNVLTILSSDGGADVTVDLSVFVTNQALSNALVGKADKIHSHTTSDIDGLDTTLSNKVDKVAGKQLSTEDYTTAEKTKLSSLSNYTLPNASAMALGGIKVGTNLSIDENGVLSANDTSVSFTEITDKPTDLSGYGITDVYTKAEVDTMIGDIISALDLGGNN